MLLGYLETPHPQPPLPQGERGSVREEDVTFANLWQRTKAFLLDYLIIAAYLVLLGGISVGLGFGPLQREFRAMFADPNSSELSAFLLLVLPVTLEALPAPVFCAPVVPVSVTGGPVKAPGTRPACRRAK